MTTNRWWRQQSEPMNLRRGGRVTVAVAAAVAAATAAAEGGRGSRVRGESRVAAAAAAARGCWREWDESRGEASYFARSVHCPNLPSRTLFFFLAFFPPPLIPALPHSVHNAHPKHGRGGPAGRARVAKGASKKCLAVATCVLYDRLLCTDLSLSPLFFYSSPPPPFSFPTTF